MGKTYDHIDDSLRRFIAGQQMFFVATAPLSGDGLINVSPKGLDSFRILDEHTVAYLDLTGSGIETLAHVRENGRIVLMFCAFAGRPMTLRLYGRGVAHEEGTTEFEELRPRFPAMQGDRSIIVVDVQRIADSCGWGVPLYDYQGQRDTLLRYYEQKGDDAVRAARDRGNTTSLDGLPGFRAG